MVLFKLSSALVERDFSQYVVITNACGIHSQKPMLHNRMFSRCNQGAYEQWNEVIGLLDEIDDDGKIEGGDSATAEHGSNEEADEEIYEKAAI